MRESRCGFPWLKRGLGDDRQQGERDLQSGRSEVTGIAQDGLPESTVGNDAIQNRGRMAYPILSKKARKTSMTRMKNLAIMKARLAIIEMNVSVLDYTIVTTYKIIYVVILV